MNFIKKLKNRIKKEVKRKIFVYSKYNGLWYPNISQPGKMERFFHLSEIYRKIENVPGDIVECGVAFGYSLIVLSILAKQEGVGRKVYGFDSFEGFPEPDLADKSFRNAQKGEYSPTTIERVRRIISNVDVPQPTLVKGFLENTLPGFKFPNKIAFLHIDVDLYSGYKTALDVLFDQVSVGGIIEFDEYNEPKWPGATKAINEFLVEKKQVLLRAKYVNKHYIIKK